MKDPYEILGVSKSASADELRRAYRRLAKEHHPDRNPNDPKAIDRFKEVQAAYEVLGDAQKREQYDRFGAGGPPPDFGQWSTGHGVDGVNVDFGDLGDLSSIFAQFFGGGFGGRASARRPHASRAKRPTAPPRRGADIAHSIEIDLEEAATGVNREIKLRSDRPGHTERLEFQVPAGVADGQKIRIAGKGQDGRGGRGDLLIQCRIRPHRYFRREGDDIHLELPLSFSEAALGAKVEIPTLNGHSVLTIPPGTSGGARMRLRGQGLPNIRTKQRGDLFAVVRIVAPKEMNDADRAHIEALAQSLDAHVRTKRPWS